MVNNTLLWIDDLRDPKSEINYQFIVSNFNVAIENIVWVKTYNECINWINSNGLPEYVSFDHDLGDILNPETEKTGYDCCKFIVDYCIDNNYEFPKYAIQSANGPGKENINSYINNFKKFYKCK